MEPTKELRETLRRQALQRRNDIPEHLRSAFSHMIKKSAQEIIEELGARTVHCYLSFRSEVDTSELIHALQADGIRIVSPVTLDDGRMESYELTEKRTVGSFAVPEPERVHRVSPSEIDAVILPVVSYDGAGTRLGYGKGFYDRFLTELTASVPKIGLAFCAQESDAIPREAHDIPLDIIITEQGLVRPDHAI